MPFEMDAWGVDVAITGSQKGLMAAAGPEPSSPPTTSARGSPPDVPACARPTGTGPFREGTEHYQKYCGTPPEHMLFGLRQSLDMLFAEGLENVLPSATGCWPRRSRRAVRRLGGARARSSSTSRVAAERANSVTTVLMNDSRDPRPLLDYCNRKCGVVVRHRHRCARRQGLPHRPYGRTSTRRWCSARWRSSRPAWSRSAFPHGRGGVQAAIDWLRPRRAGMIGRHDRDRFSFLRSCGRRRPGRR